MDVVVVAVVVVVAKYIIHDRPFPATTSNAGRTIWWFL